MRNQSIVLTLHQQLEVYHPSLTDTIVSVTRVCTSVTPGHAVNAQCTIVCLQRNMTKGESSYGAIESSIQLADSMAI